jgi:hypothetical protein
MILIELTSIEEGKGEKGDESLGVEIPKGQPTT